MVIVVCKQKTHTPRTCVREKQRLALFYSSFKKNAIYCYERDSLPSAVQCLIQPVISPNELLSTAVDKMESSCSSLWHKKKEEKH